MFVFGNLPSVMESTNSFFYFNFLFLFSLPPIVLVCALVFFEGSQKEGQVLKGYEFPQGKRRFRPVAVSRHSPGKNDFDFDL